MTKTVAPDPTPEQVERAVRLAADLPTTDIARQLYEVQNAGRDTMGAQLIRRAIAEILALRLALHQKMRGE